MCFNTVVTAHWEYASHTQQEKRPRVLVPFEDAYVYELRETTGVDRNTTTCLKRRCHELVYLRETTIAMSVLRMGVRRIFAGREKEW